MVDIEVMKTGRVPNLDVVLCVEKFAMHLEHNKCEDYEKK
jgi:hypothetical protein